MRLKNIDPTTLFKRTIIYRRQFWRVKTVEGTSLHLDKHGRPDHKGLLKTWQLSECRLYPTIESVESAYPRLLRALRWGALLTTGEASS